MQKEVVFWEGGLCIGDAAVVAWVVRGRSSGLLRVMAFTPLSPPCPLVPVPALQILACKFLDSPSSVLPCILQQTGNCASHFLPLFFLPLLLFSTICKVNTLLLYNHHSLSNPTPAWSMDPRVISNLHIPRSVATYVHNAHLVLSVGKRAAKGWHAKPFPSILCS